MKFAAVVLLSCVALAASKAIELIPAFPGAAEAQASTQCASVCLWRGIYNFPSFQSCTSYIHCVHGFLFQLDCNPGDEFDHVTLRCQSSENARCVLEGIPDSSSEGTSEGTSEETSEGTSEEDISEGTSEDTDEGTEEAAAPLF